MIIPIKKEDNVNYEDPYYGINFIPRKAEIYSSDHKLLFSEEVSFPEYYNDNSVNIIASKYLCNNAKRKETSLKDMIDRVSETISSWGMKDGYFKTEEERKIFEDRLKYYQVHQYFSFNSPVYFNVGLMEKPQCSACFILEIEDNMESIFEVEQIESKIFKWGSGSGMNMSSLRSCKEKVRGAGHASGPTSFLKAHDIAAGVVKSGGVLRRSAKIAILNMDHPDIEDFIDCKKKEEQKLKILRDNGFTPEKGEDLSDHAFYQNTNFSVRITDDFMKRVENNEEWWTRFVTTKENYKSYNARDLLWKVAETSWEIADPGIQFHDTMNAWNTCLKSGPIESTNPCGEFVWHNNSSCNLSSMNLIKFFKKNPVNGNIYFDLVEFKELVNLAIIAQDILIDNASYPTKKISKNTHDFRPLGLGFSNLGATLMWLGFPYDSIEARTITSAITALMTACAYNTSSNMAVEKEPFEKFEENKDSFYKILDKHFEHLSKLISSNLNNHEITQSLLDMASSEWNTLIQRRKDGLPFRNAQATLLAPTGTISFFMGCDTTGGEPESSLMKYKTLSGQDGSVMKIVNTVVKESLENLGYSTEQIEDFISIILKDGHLENSKIDKDHLKIFDTSLTHNGGKRFIDYMGHLKMVAAVQPFISGSISKTVNLPNNATVEEIFELYIKAWKMGLKGVTVYRDGSKTFQPLNTSEKKNEEKPKDNCKDCKKVLKRKLPDDVDSKRHKFRVGEAKGYLIQGLHEDGKLGEIFIEIAKEGSTLSGMLDSLAIVTSIALQYHVPLKDLVKKLMHVSFPPFGMTNNTKIRTADSIVDYIFRYLGSKYLSKEEKLEIGLNLKEEVDENSKVKEEDKETSRVKDVVKNTCNSPACQSCGDLMTRKGTCFVCDNCGESSGSCS